MFLIDVLCGFPKTVWPHKAGCSFKVVSSEIVYRDLVKNRDLTLRFWQRDSVEISYRHLVHIALQRDLAQISHTIFDIFTKGACRIEPGISSSRDHLENEHHAFTRVALVPLAWSHWLWGPFNLSLQNANYTLFGGFSPMIWDFKPETMGHFTHVGAHIPKMLPESATRWYSDLPNLWGS